MLGHAAVSSVAASGKKFWVESVVVHEVVQYLAEDPLVLFHHIHRFEKRMISVAQEIDIPSMKLTVFVVWFAFDDFAQAAKAMEGRSLFHDAAQNREVIGVNLTSFRNSVQLLEHGDVIKV
ncbi:hypothetical protein, partial [Thiolapillus sp.]|uniref:hypothetical protein n=1 Tax=Thiolapillus sp. TaxID=2017437 RepID=UPI003AF829EE